MSDPIQRRKKEVEAIREAADAETRSRVYAQNLQTREIPAGGSDGQVLTKKNSNDYNVEWADLPEAESGDSGFDPDITIYTVDASQEVSDASEDALHLTASSATPAATTSLSGTDAITIGFTGWVRVSFGVTFYSTGVRVCPWFWITLNGTTVIGLESRHTYIRQGGQSYSSANATQVFPVSSGDTLQLMSKRGSSVTTSVTVSGSNSGITIERVV